MMKREEGTPIVVRKPEQKTQTAVDAGVLEAVIRRIVEVAQPDKIILFGSAARGEMGPNSDLDLLVVKSGVPHRGRLMESIYENLLGVGQAVDVVVATPEDIERYRDAFCLVVSPALREGRVVYEREAEGVISRPDYEPPRATRLGDAHPGAGADCSPAGSGATEFCIIGSSATQICNAGSSAGGGCGGYGNSAGAECVGNGSGPGTDCWLEGSGY